MPSRHSSAKTEIHPSSIISHKLHVPHSSELHGAETAAIVHPLELKLLEPVVVVVAT